MFNAPYPFCSLGKTDTNGKDPYRKMYYKFYAAQRNYLVTFEFFSFGLVAVKYCDVKDKNSKYAYHKIFNDKDAFRVIGTCFHIMHQYWRKNNNVNFCFYASLRDIADEILKSKTLAPEDVDRFIHSYRRARYTIYRYGMLNLFPPDYFIPSSDRENCIYVLTNKNQKDPSQMMEALQDFLYKNHRVIFNPEYDSVSSGKAFDLSLFPYSLYLCRI